jgi:uncharacterized surface protein with fasciclin (FAS1) repeats
MKNLLFRKKILLILLISCFLFNSCKDDFFELNTPSWLGASIYDQLKEGYLEDNGTAHTFTYYLRLIDDIGYAEVLKTTGSKTLFAADDKAFERFFTSNVWGVKSYDEFSIAQKKMILNSALINNAYLIELMSNTEGPTEGQALRRPTALSAIDSICFEKGDSLPAGSYWDYYRSKGIHLMKDNTSIPMVHFLQKQMSYKGISNEDFSILFNGVTRVDNDAHIYGIKVIVRDITCKNGYINILENVLIPPSNMAEVIRTAPETKVFSSLLERFSAPYYDAPATTVYMLLHPEFTDSIFTKRYFSERSSNGSNLKDPKAKGQLGYLEFDPGWNNYTVNNFSTAQNDMGAIFVPSDQILNKFFNEGGGKFLIDRFGAKENIPSDVIDDLLRNHMKASFIGSTPGKFSLIMDDAKDPMKIQKSDVIKSYVTNNGVVYVTNKVYAPASYVAVIAPALVSENLKIFNWAVKTLQFDAYLLSMDSYYSFIVPVDQSSPYNDIMGKGIYYIDPVSLGKNQPEIFKFWYNTKATSTAEQVKATAYKYTPGTGEIGDSIRIVTAVEIKDRLEDILDYHIVVGNIEDGKNFYITKGGGQIHINGAGAGMKISGGGNLENSTQSNVNKVYDQTAATNGRGNGKTYITDSPLQSSYKSVYKVLSEHAEFSEFFKLLQGNDEATAAEHLKYDIFYKDKSYAGLDYNVEFFNTFNYTIYVPTNEKVLAAIAAGLPTWDLIKQQTDEEIKTQMTDRLVKFLRYHFQDNSVYIDGSTKTAKYETAVLNSATGRYYTINTARSANDLVLTTANGGIARVVKDKNLYNIMARDYKFDKADPKIATQIETSSFAVIHQIDNVLYFQ